VDATGFERIKLKCLEDCDLGEAGTIFHVNHHVGFKNELYKFWPKED
jgi:hypothetical protein